jgi:hypothetical protein
MAKVAGSGDKKESNSKIVYGNHYVSFWNSGKSVLQVGVYKQINTDTEREFPYVSLKVQLIDEDNKFIKNEEGKYVNGYFSLSEFEFISLYYQFQNMVKVINGDDSAEIDDIHSCMITHIDEDKNGSILIIFRQDDEYYIGIEMVVDGEVTDGYYHPLSGTSSYEIYYMDENDDEKSTYIDANFIKFKSLMDTIFATAYGIGAGVAECTRGGSRGNSSSKSGGLGGIKRKNRTSLSNRNKEMLQEEDDEDEEEDEKPKKKTVSKKKTVKKSNMAELLEEDDDED